jgi:hypothetical protein
MLPTAEKQTCLVDAKYRPTFMVRVKETLHRFQTAQIINGQSCSEFYACMGMIYI